MISKFNAITVKIFLYLAFLLLSVYVVLNLIDITQIAYSNHFSLVVLDIDYIITTACIAWIVFGVAVFLATIEFILSFFKRESVVGFYEFFVILIFLLFIIDIIYLIILKPKFSLISTSFSTFFQSNNVSHDTIIFAKELINEFILIFIISIISLLTILISIFVTFINKTRYCREGNTQILNKCNEGCEESKVKSEIINNLDGSVESKEVKQMSEEELAIQQRYDELMLKIKKLNDE